ncbi:MAG: stage II sporulation protein M [Eubacteriales bacterium]|nr:stage II sporulation protein M [Eubacteriales bacterium]
MKKRINSDRKKGFPGLVLFLGGFLLGNLIPNILWKMEWQQKTIASVYLLEIFVDRGISGREYLLELLRMRGSYYILCTICGCSVFGVPVAVAGTILFGAELGSLFAMSVLSFGLSGGLVWIGLLLPQYLIYVPVTLCFMSWIFELSFGIWKNRGIFPEKAGRFAGKVILGALIYMGGIFLECYVNPWVTEKILGFADLF